MSIFAQDCSEQPKAVRELIVHAEETKRKADLFKPVSLLILGMGASYYAGLYATVYANESGFNCRCEELSEVLWYWDEKNFDLYDTIALVSQSGETVELRKLIERYPKIKEKIHPHHEQPIQLRCESLESGQSLSDTRRAGTRHGLNQDFRQQHFDPTPHHITMGGTSSEL